MPSYKYKTEEEHQAHLAWRRQYYAENRERICAKNNEAVRKAKAAKANTSDKPKQKKRNKLPIEKNATKTKKNQANENPSDAISKNPESKQILNAILKESLEKGKKGGGQTHG